MHMAILEAERVLTTQGPASRLMHMCRKKSRPRTETMRSNSGQARNTITHALNATLAPTCMLHAQCMAILEVEGVAHNPMCPASKQKEKQARNSFLLKTEDKLRPGQEHNHTTHDTCTDCNSDSDMHVVCSMHGNSGSQMGFHNSKSCKQAERKANQELFLAENRGQNQARPIGNR